MPNTVPDGRDASTDRSENAAGATPEAVAAEQANDAPAWSRLKVAVIDDAMHPPRLDRLSESEAASLHTLLTKDAEVIAELTGLGCTSASTPDEKLLAISEADERLEIEAKIGPLSSDASRMIEEYRSFCRLVACLASEVAEVKSIDPFTDIPDLTSCDLVLMDYYLQGLARGGDLALEVASKIKAQAGKDGEQQIVLMSSNEGVRQLRTRFRAESALTGPAFAFVGKPDLNENWKVKAHLGMLTRARPYAPAFSAFRSTLGEALEKASKDLLMLVDDLDIGDYAFLQSHALMKDGHPLGDYVLWLLSSQLLALAFERKEMRTRQRELDRLEFVGSPFTAAEPSTVVANFLHSALVCRDIGPLAPHPRAKQESKYSKFPLVQLGDVFFDVDRTKAVVVMSADCDLAFSPMEAREPDPETPIMLVPGSPVKMREPAEESTPQTEGLLHREEVYRIEWDFAKYRSVDLANVELWLTERKFNIANRDRLRPLFGLKLQQEFGAHLLRVGPPLTPPTTTLAVGRIFICMPARQEADGTPMELTVTRFKGSTLLRMTPPIASTLKRACEDLLSLLNEDFDNEKDVKSRANAKKKVTSLTNQVNNDEFWIGLLEGVELNAMGTLKNEDPLGFVLGPNWKDPNKPRVVLQIDETAKPSPKPTGVALGAIEPEAQAGAVSGAD